MPPTTVHYYASGKAELGARPGPATVLTREEEKELELCAIKMSKIGYGQTRRQVCEMVKAMLDRTRWTSPFPDNQPGKDWGNGFLRHQYKALVHKIGKHTVFQAHIQLLNLVDDDLSICVEMDDENRENTFLEELTTAEGEAEDASQEMDEEDEFDDSPIIKLKTYKELSWVKDWVPH